MINIIAPINPLGYGVTGLNITKSLYKIDQSISLNIIGDPFLTDQKDADIVRECNKNGMMPKWDNPCLRIWHQHDMSMFIGNGPKIGFPIFELEEFDDLEKYHLSHLDKIFVCSHWAKEVVLKNIDISDDNVNVVPLGVDSSIFPVVEKLKIKDHQQYFLIAESGKSEKVMMCFVIYSQTLFQKMTTLNCG